MTFFRNFTIPLWEIFGGNLLLLLCSLFYLAWWTVVFNPNSNNSGSGGIFISIAFITGIAALALMSHSISSLSQYSKGLPVKFILVGSAALFVGILLITVIVFHRIITSELIIIHIWTALELSAVAVLYGTERFGPGRTAILSALTGIVFVIGMICYVLYYRLDESARYWDGMIPLVADAFTAMVFAVVLAIS